MDWLSLPLEMAHQKLEKVDISALDVNQKVNVANFRVQFSKFHGLIKSYDYLCLNCPFFHFQILFT